ncbi:MAG: hypothetical protein ACXWEY_16060 [Bacteroidia bacterium]
MDFGISGQNYEYNGHIVSHAISKFQPLIREFLKKKSYGESVREYFFVLNTLSDKDNIHFGKDVKYIRNERVVLVKGKVGSKIKDATDLKEQEEILLKAILYGILEINKLRIKKINDQQMYEDLKQFFISQG